MSMYHKNNPFINNLTHRYEAKELRSYKEVVIQAGIEPGEFATDDEGKPIVVKTGGVLVKKEFDTQSYVKIFRDSVPLLLNLSRPALDFVLYIVAVIRPKQDFVEFSTDDVMSFLGYTSRQSIYKAIDTLEKAGILAKRHNTRRGNQAYWINPEVIYNGSRNSLHNKSKYIIKNDTEYRAAVIKRDDILSGRDISQLSEQEYSLVEALTDRIHDWEQSKI